MYNPVYLPSFNREVKKIDKLLKKRVKEEVELLITDPSKGEELTGDLQGFQSYHLKYNQVQYRIAYKVEGEDIVFIKFGKRENFYKELKQRIH
jgi:mRNA interferase RelE/StbE